MTTGKNNRTTVTNDHRSKPKDLDEVITNWFLIEPAESTQALLWIVIKAAIESQAANEWNPNTRSNVMFLYERIHNLLADLDSVNTTHKYKQLHEI